MKLLKFIKNYVNITVRKVAVAHSVNLYFYCKFILLQNPFERDAIPFTAEGDFFILQMRKKLIQQRNLVNF